MGDQTLVEELRPRFVGMHSLTPIRNAYTGVFLKGQKKSRWGFPQKMVKKCAHEGCMKISPVFNKPGEKRGFLCKEHKEEGMVDVQSKRCAHEGCLMQPRIQRPGRDAWQILWRPQARGDGQRRFKKMRPRGVLPDTSVQPPGREGRQVLLPSTS